jgi:hypothetical protein
LILPFVPDSAHTVGPSASVRFIPTLGENTVMTGLAIAVLGALEKALQLLGKIAEAGSQTRSPMRTNQPLATAPAGPIPNGLVQMQAPMLMPQRAPNDVVTRGALNGRDYVLFRDGSVVVETLLGPRRFSSITEAQEFIGAN